MTNEHENEQHANATDNNGTSNPLMSIPDLQRVLELYGPEDSLTSILRHVLEHLRVIQARSDRLEAELADLKRVVDDRDWELGD